MEILEVIWDLESILGLILAHPSSTCLEKQRSETEGVRHGTFADAHPPSQNAVFEDKCWKGVPKSSPESILGSIWGPLGPPGLGSQPGPTPFLCMFFLRGPPGSIWEPPGSIWEPPGVVFSSLLTNLSSFRTNFS